MGSGKLYADETRLPVLDPGRGKTRTAQLWAYGRDDRPWGGSDPPAVVYRYEDGRGSAYPRRHLAGFEGVLQVDGYGGYKSLVTGKPGGEAPMPITLAFCWSHLRRLFYDLAKTSPIAREALERIGALYAIEKEIRGRPAAERLAVRREKSRPEVDAMRDWLDQAAARVSGKSKLGEALRYAQRHWAGLSLFLEDGRVELDTNMVERTIRPVALTRKNALFAGSNDGGRHWAMVSSLIQTAKLNDVDPFAYLKDVLETLVNDFPQSRLDELLPWAWKENHQPRNTPA